MRSIIVFACVCLLANGNEERLFNFMDGGSSASQAKAVPASATAGAHAVVSADPVIISNGSSKAKKIVVTITKEITKGEHPVGVHAGGAHATAPVFVPHQHMGLVPQVHIDNNAIAIDNETIPSILQQLLTGNIENVQGHGRPLALPANGKHVAVIYSSSVHVVDLGDIRPPPVRPILPIKHKRAHPVQHHPVHKVNHEPLNHASFLNTLLEPLMSLTHLGAHTAGPAVQTVVQPVQTAPQMQLQPVIMMLPMGNSMQQMSTLQAQQLPNDLLQNLLAAKGQMLTQKLQAKAAAKAAKAQAKAVAKAAKAVSKAHKAHAVQPHPVVVAQAEAGVVAPVIVAPLQRKPVKKFSITVQKTKTVL